MCGGGNDAIDEDESILCCAVCCANIAIYPAVDCFGCSGKAGICCLNLEFCCKPDAPCLFPCCCLGVKVECDGCSLVNAQVHCCCTVASLAIPCNTEVPVAVSILGLTVFPKCGICMKQKEIMNR